MSYLGSTLMAGSSACSIEWCLQTASLQPHTVCNWSVNTQVERGEEYSWLQISGTYNSYQQQCNQYLGADQRQLPLSSVSAEARHEHSRQQGDLWRVIPTMATFSKSDLRQSFLSKWLWHFHVEDGVLDLQYAQLCCRAYTACFSFCCWPYCLSSP